jgi:hypothetical protein
MKPILSSITVCVALLMMTSLKAQTVILDFESAATSTTFTYFGSSQDGSPTTVIANPNATGINTSANVTRYVKPAGAQTWAGAFSDPNPTNAIDLTTNTRICVKVHSDHIGNLAIKLEGGVAGAPNWIRTVANTVVNAWEELCFDTNLPSVEAPIVTAAGNIYERLVVFFDFGSSPTEEQVFYFDDVVTREAVQQQFDVSFAVDMDEYAGSFNTVYVSGSFNNWSGDANPLSDADGDGVWTATLSLPSGAYEYKFTVDNWSAQESFIGTETCTVTSFGFTNRELVVAGPSDLPTVCYNSCYACGESVDITIQLGSGGIPVSAQGLFIAGGGNFGNPGDFPLADADGDGIWTITLNRPRGFTSYYTFTNGACPDYSCKENIAGQDCANPNNFNDRLMGPIQQDTIIQTCFGQCTTTANCGNAAQPGSISFRVDMRNYSGSFNQVYVSGSFNNWSGDANPMSDANSDGIWEVTLDLPGGQHEYKFSLDNWANSEQLTPGESCVITDPSGQFTNRLLSVDGDAALELVCFASCAACAPSSVTDADGKLVFTIYPTLVQERAQLVLHESVAGQDSWLSIVDAGGRVVQQQPVGLQLELSLDMSGLASGMYWVRLYTGEQVYTARLVKLTN